MIAGRVVAIGEPPARSRPGVMRRLEVAARQFVGRLAGRLGVPGCVQPMVLDDAVTRYRVKVEVGPRFVVFSVGARDYYFYRWSGKFDGTGMGCDCGPVKEK